PVRPPPTAPPFPSATLFRSAPTQGRTARLPHGRRANYRPVPSLIHAPSPLHCPARPRHPVPPHANAPLGTACGTCPWGRPEGRRSEEHTSALQSREKLVCRL